jgi:hypothetical protein
MVLSKVGHALSHSILGSNLAGDGLLVRIRSTSIALFGLVTMIGLGLVVFISQQGWPGAFSSPIPANPPELGAVHDAVALSRSSPAGAPARAGGSSRNAIHTRASGAGRGSRSSVSPGLRQAHQVASAPHTTQPAPPPSPAPTSPEASPAPTPTVVDSPVSGSADQPQGPSTSQPKTAASTPGAAKDHGSSEDKPHRGSKAMSTGKAKAYSTPPSKSNHHSPGKKPAESHGAPAPPAPEPGSKEAAPEGGGKDPGYSGQGNGKSGKGDH